MPRVSPDYEYVDGDRQFVGYSAKREVEISLSLTDEYYSIVNAIIQTNSITTLDSKFSVQDPEAVIDKAQLLALDDARERAERLAVHAGTRLAGVYSISEFNLRKWEPELLVPARQLAESILGKEFDLSSLGSEIKYRSRSSLFEPESLEAQATIFVVYLLEDD